MSQVFHIDPKVCSRELRRLKIPYRDHARVRALALAYVRELGKSGDDGLDFSIAARFAWESVREFRRLMQIEI